MDGDRRIAPPRPDPVTSDGQVVVYDAHVDPRQDGYLVVVHSRWGTHVRAHAFPGQRWRFRGSGGHHLDVRLTAVGPAFPSRQAGLVCRMAEWSVSHARNCPGCSGLSPGTAARAVQTARAESLLQVQRGRES